MINLMQGDCLELMYDIPDGKTADRGRGERPAYRRAGTTEPGVGIRGKKRRDRKTP